MLHYAYQYRSRLLRRVPGRETYGLRREGEFRRGLGAEEKLIVHHDEAEDAIYKMDAVVRFRGEPMLPAVGVQFTIKSDLDKMSRTIEAIRRSRIVSRLLYLEADCELSKPAFTLLSDLIRFVATSPRGREVLCAVLASDATDKYWLTDLKCFPLETKTVETPQRREGRAA